MPSLPASNGRTCWIDPTAQGPTWIALGVLWIGVAQFMSGWPIATAIGVIGYGSTLSTIVLKHKKHEGQGGRRKAFSHHGYRIPVGMASLLNLPVYVGLIGFAIAAQWDLALRSPAAALGPIMAMDHLLALLFLLGMIRQTVNGLIAESL